jgi:IclR family acetate operon transcriptional repressor
MNSPDDSRDAGGPRSLARLLQLFDVLAAAPDGLSLAELNTMLETPKSSLLNLLRPLVADGYLVHSRSRYRLGIRAFRLATGIMAAWDLARVYLPFVEMLAARSDETAMLAVADLPSGTLSYVDVVVSAQPVRYQLAEGTTRPLHGAAAGRVLLAYSPPGLVKAYLRGAELDSAMHKPFTRKGLKAELAAIRAAGHASSIDTFIQGLGSIASPILDSAGHCVAALAIGGPSDRISANLDAHIVAVRKVAHLATQAGSDLPAPG